jgi:adenylylsulfate kinase-like enzyme
MGGEDDDDDDDIGRDGRKRRRAESKRRRMGWCEEGRNANAEEDTAWMRVARLMQAFVVVVVVVAMVPFESERDEESRQYGVL